MIFADTGYFVAFLKERDDLHARALRWAATIQEPILITEYVLVEVADACSAPLMRARLHVFLERLRASRDFEIVPRHRNF
jgi:predicted nucleic acid-binding protein